MVAESITKRRNGAAAVVDNRGSGGGRSNGDAPSRRSWAFATRPFWLFSHAFALAVVVLFVILGFWQLSRHNDRQDANAIVEQRTSLAAAVVDDSGDLDGDPSGLDFAPVVVTGAYVDADYVRVVNRSQAGSAGEYVVGIVALADGSLVAVNRGFVPVNADVELAAVPAGTVMLEGWLRASVNKGRFGVDDSGTGDKIPRFNTDDLARRLDADLPAVWVQLADDDPAVVAFPDPVPLPALDAGPHLSYAAQWFIFATLGVLFYGALLRRQAGTPGSDRVTTAGTDAAA